MTANMSIKENKIMQEEIRQEEEIQEPKIIKCKCKPCFNFQSVEFEYEVSTKEDIEDMMAIYKLFLDGLQNIAPVQTVVKPEAPEKKMELATEKQVELAKKIGLKLPKVCSKEDAQRLIKEHLEARK
jgi:hypothetical protein